MVRCLHRLLQCKPLWTFAFQKSKVKSVAWDCISSFYTLVFLPGVWKQMTNDTEGSTSRSLKVSERYDLSLWLTRAISLHTYSKVMTESISFPGLFFPITLPSAFPWFWSVLQDKDLLFLRSSHLDPGRVRPGWIWITYDDVSYWKQHEVTVAITSEKHWKLSKKCI